MGGWRVRGRAVLAAALLRTTLAAAATTVEPIARLSLEGGYDSNVLLDGHSEDQVVRFAPDVGLRLRDHHLDLAATYGGELLWYERLAPQGVWNQRAALTLDTRLDRRTSLGGDLRVWQAFDPAQLAQAGIFRVGGQRALLVFGRSRLEWHADRPDSVALTYLERTVLFDDKTGGAMHAPGVEVLRRVDERLQLGAAYAFGAYTSFLPGEDEHASSHGVRMTARWRATRHLALEAWAGPALWLPQGGASAILPEVFLQALVATRGLDLRVSVGHALGLGATAQPGVVDSAEVGLEKRWGRSWFLRGDGGLWHSGLAPTGEGAVTGYATASEVGLILHGGLRLSLRGAHYGRADAVVPQYQRTTLGLRVAWELQPR
jgi:hypothetical protein